MDAVERVKDRGGSVLVVALWAMAALLLLVVSLASRTRTGLRLAGYAWDEARLVQTAKAGAVLTAASLRLESSSFTALSQPWGDSPGFFKDRPAGEGRFTLLPGPDSGAPRYGPADESSRININHVPEDVLERVFGGAAAAVADWRDADRAARPGGAEDPAYGTESRPYPCRNGPFLTVEELLLVQGITPDLFHRVKDRLTVYGGGRVNVNTASGAVLEDLGLPPAAVGGILAFRRGRDGTDGTEDDGVFRSLEDVSPALAPLAPAEAASLEAIMNRGLLTVRSQAWRLELLARLEDSRAARRFIVVIPALDPSGSILYWREEI